MSIQIDPALKALIPPLSQEERALLEESILEHGCRDPLVVWPLPEYIEDGHTFKWDEAELDHVIGTDEVIKSWWLDNGDCIDEADWPCLLIDGHNRYEICERHGLPYDTVQMEFADRQAAEDWMDANQLGRRNLTPDSFRMILGRRYHRQKSEHGGDRKSGNSSGQNDHLKESTAAKLAKEHAVSERTVRRAEEFYKEVESKPELKKALDEHIPVAKVKKQIRAKEIAEERKALAESVKDEPKTSLFQIKRCDLAEYRPPELVDAIITDPPYPREFLPLWSVLAQKANEWLKPGGIVVAMSGQAYLAEVYARMSEHLDYYWTACYHTPGQPTPLRHVNVNTTWKPLLIFTRRGERYTGKIFGDFMKSDQNEKDFHKWGQSVSGMDSILERFALPGQTVLDPFCGAGTTGIAAIKRGCRFYGCEIEEENVKISIARIGEVAA